MNIVARTAKYVAVSVLALGLTTIASQASAQSTTLKVAPHASLRLLDPLTTTAYITRNHGYMVYDTLFALDMNSKPQPQMVESWTTSEDGLRWTFKLRDGLRFHNGAAVTSEDVIVSLQRWMKRDLTGKQLQELVQKMRAINAQEFELVLSSPFGPMLDALGKPSSLVPFVMPKSVVEAAGDQSITEVIGSGPFRFIADEFQPGVKVVYEKFEDYVPRTEEVSGMAGGKQVSVDRVEWISFPDAQTSLNALRNGEIDLIERLNFDDAQQLKGNKNVVLQRLHTISAPTMRINWLQPPFDNVKVRQAVLHAISQRDFMDAIVGDPEGYSLCGALFGCGTPLESEAGVVVKDEADLEAAKTLLKESGYDNEKVVILHNTDTQSFQGLAQVTAQMLRSIGMDVEVQSMDFATYLARRSQKDSVADGGWSIAYGVWEVLDLMSPLANLNLDTRGPEGYAGWSSNAEMDVLKTAFVAEMDATKQAEIAEKIQRIAYEQVFYIPLGNWFNYAAYRDNITLNPNVLFTVFWSVSKK